METSAQFSFRAPTPFIAEAEAAARLTHAVLSKRWTAASWKSAFAALSRQLSALSLAEVEAIEDASADGLND